MKPLDLKSIADDLGISLRTVQDWISAGELKAVNVSRNRNSRKPRLRVLEEDLQAFLAGRSVGAKKQPEARKRRGKKPVKQFV